MKPKTLIIIGAILLSGGMALLIILNLPLQVGYSFTFDAPGEPPIAATYYPGTRDAGVLLFSGFGADQVMMNPIGAEYSRAGIHVMTWDYPGHGLTGGGLGFDNAGTDRLSSISQRAMQVFMQKSGLPAERILWLGHSLGARVAMQSAVLGPERPAGLALLGVQVNLGYNAQSEFFTGTSDSDLEWVQSLDSSTPSVPILLISGTWEDILTVDAATLLMSQLCSSQTNIIPNTACFTAYPREWLLFDNLVHNYEIYSPRAISAVMSWSADRVGYADLAQSTPFAAWRIAGWLIAGMGIFITLIGLYQLVRTRYLVDTIGYYGVRIIDPRRWLWGKALLWLGALPIAVILMVLYLFIPLNAPTFNLIYGGFIGGYAILMVALYLLGRVPGVNGKLILPQKGQPVEWKRWVLAGAFNLAVFAILTFYFRSGQGQVPPIGERFVWIILFMPFTALGFWLGVVEISTLVRDHPGKAGFVRWAIVIGLFPFILRALLLAVLASTSGMLGAFTGLAVFALVILQGEVTRLLTGQPLMAAVLASILLYWLLLPSGPLFLPFF